MSDRPVPQYLVVNRFDDEFGEYHRFVEPGSCRLAYLTLPGGLAVLDEASALEIVVVDDLELATLLPHARRLAEQYGGFDAIVGPSEYDVQVSAELRVALGVPGWTPEFVTAFRDKLPMKRRLAEAGLRVPRFAHLTEESSAERLAAEIGFPMILKPRSGWSARGVQKIADEAGLAVALAGVEPAEFECEEYVEGRILHVDGIRRDGKFGFVSASTYLNTCLDFTVGLPLGSVLLNPGQELDRVTGFAGECLDALGLDDGPFHMELFDTPQGELVFLEVGLRPGGAEVPFVHRDLFGIDLYREAFRVTVGLPPAPEDQQLEPYTGSGGWVSVPEPRPLPCRVTATTSMLATVPEVYAEVLPPVGTVFDGTGGYEHIGGRFRLRGADHVSVCRAALQVMAEYRVLTTAVPDQEG